MRPAAAIARARTRLENLAGDELLAKLARGGLTALIIKVGAAGLSFLMFLMLARAMSAEEYGRFGFGFSLAMFLSVIASLGLHTGILRWWPEFTGKGAADAARNSLALGAAGTFVSSLAILGAGSVGVWLYSRGSSHGEGYPYALLSLVLPLALSEYLACAIRATGRLSLAVIPKEVVWRFSVVIFSLICLYFNMNIDATNAFLFTGAALFLVFAVQFYMFARRSGSLKFSHLQLPGTGQLLREAVPMWGAAVLASVTIHVDVLLLGMFLSPEEIGPYFSAVRIASILGLLLVASNFIVAPMISQIFYSGRGSDLQRLLNLNNKLILIPSVVGYLIVVFYGANILDLFGNGFGSAHCVLILISTGSLVNTICGPTGYLLQMTGHQRAYLNIMLITYAILTALQLIVIPLYGATGAASISLSGMIIWNLWSRSFAVRQLGVDPTIFALFARRKG